MPNNADFYSDGILGFIPIFSAIDLNDPIIIGTIVANFDNFIPEIDIFLKLLNFFDFDIRLNRNVEEDFFTIFFFFLFFYNDSDVFLDGIKDAV